MSDVDLYAEFGPMAAPTKPRPPAARTGSSLLAVGVASRYGVPSLAPIYHETLRRHFPRVVLLPGCFAASIKCAAAGSHVIRFEANHDGRLELASTADGSIIFLDVADAIHVGVTAKGRGPKAAEFLREFGHLRQLSVAFSPVKMRAGRDAAGPTTIVETAILGEVSAVGAGNFPGCGLRLRLK